jgi:hypothetical protein
VDELSKRNSSEGRGRKQESMKRKRKTLIEKKKQSEDRPLILLLACEYRHG